MKLNLVRIAIIVVTMLIGSTINFLGMYSQGYRLPDPVKIDFKCQTQDGMTEGESQSLNTVVANLKTADACLMRVTPGSK